MQNLTRDTFKIVSVIICLGANKILWYKSMFLSAYLSYYNRSCFQQRKNIGVTICLILFYYFVETGGQQVVAL